MKLGATPTFFACALVLTIGCGDSHMDNGEEDAAIVFPDASFPDAGTDSGPPPSNVGERCSNDEQCAEGGEESYCEPWLGGYCTNYCDEEVPCPHGSTCIGLGGGRNVCVRECDPTAGGDQCPAGNGCSPAGSGLPPICLPGCEDDTDCPDGRLCEVGGGGFGSGACIDPNVEIGAACVEREQCGPNSVCFAERFYEWPAGSCVGLGCDHRANTGCPGDAVCVEATDGSGLCIDGCEEDGDCRDPYACRPVDRDEPEGPKACLPACTSNDQCTWTTGDGTAHVCNAGTGYCTRPFNPAELGNTCAPNDRRSCGGGRCMTEAGSGWPSTMCVYPGCSLSGATPSATCPTDSVCTDDGAGDPDLGVCVPSCTVDASTCRAGYACAALSEGSTEGACRPACTETTCTGGRTCDTETGLCVRNTDGD